MTTPNRFVSGAIDLGEVKARAEARAQAEQAAASGQQAVDPAVTVTMDTAEAAIVERSFQVPVVVLVGSARSADSEQLRADLTDLAHGARLAWVFAYVDADTTPELARMLGIQALPTVIVMAGGQPLTSFQGGQPLEALQQFTVSVVSACAGKLSGIPPAEESSDEPAVDPRFQPVAEALAAGDYETAEQVVSRLRAQHPSDKQVDMYAAKVGLAKRLDGVDAAAAIAAGRAEGASISAALLAADCLLSRGEIGPGLSLLTDRLVGAGPDDKKLLRERLLALFLLCEPTDSDVCAARSAMASALF